MFTGIVQACLPISKLEKKAGLITFSIKLPKGLSADLSLGASIAINGICLTVTDFQNKNNEVEVAFDMMQQTLNLTNANTFIAGAAVNIERSAKAMQEVGGHIVSGHIDCLAEIVGIEHTENNCRMRFQLPAKYSKYILDKGFVALNGCSLTIANCDAKENWLEVCFIPETLRSTNFGLMEIGDCVNLEVERATQAIVDTVERVLAERNV